MEEKKLVVMEDLGAGGTYLSSFENNPDSFAFTSHYTNAINEALNIPLDLFERFTREDQEQYEHLAKGLDCKLVVVTLQIGEGEDLDLDNITSGKETSRQDIFKALFG